MANFLTRIADCDSQIPAILYFFLSSEVSICFTMVFPPLGNFDHVVVSVSTEFPSSSNPDAPFHRIAYDYVSRIHSHKLCDEVGHSVLD